MAGVWKRQNVGVFIDKDLKKIKNFYKLEIRKCSYNSQQIKTKNNCLEH